MRNNKLKIIFTVLSAAVLTFIGCDGGDTDGGKAADEDFHDAPFVPNEDNSGSISLEVNEELFNVADSTGFIVQVKDQSNTGVPDITVACDSEDGIAILEPTTGAEITDSGGRISGRIGCNAPGSYLFGCRLPVGGNLRKFVTIRCQGPIPTGFNGFDGAAGGGLGTGGSDTDGDGGVGGVDTNGVRVLAISVNDQGSTSSEGNFEIDTTQDICTPDDPATPGDQTVYENIYNGYVTFKVVNNTNSTIKFTTMKYNIPGVGTSSSIAFIGDGEVAPDGAEATLTALAYTVVGGGGSDKYIPRGSTNANIAISSNTGTKNTKFTISGTTGQGEQVSISGTTAITYTDFDNCGS